MHFVGSQRSLIQQACDFLACLLHGGRCCHSRGHPHHQKRDQTTSLHPWAWAAVCLSRIPWDLWEDGKILTWISGVHHLSEIPGLGNRMRLPPRPDSAIHNLAAESACSWGGKIRWTCGHSRSANMMPSTRAWMPQPHPAALSRVSCAVTSCAVRRTRPGPDSLSQLALAVLRWEAAAGGFLTTLLLKLGSGDVYHCGRLESMHGHLEVKRSGIC
jgi:hypothetical protein